MKRINKMSYLSDKKGVNIVFEFRDDSWFDKKDVIDLFKKRKWTLGGTDINKKKGQYWMGNMPTGLHLPEKTSNCTYLRIHGGRGYRGNYDLRKLKSIATDIKKKKTEYNYVIFNNVFFSNRSKSCKVKTKEIRYAALCDAKKFGQMIKK